MTNGAISLPTSAARVLRFLAGGPASVMPAARVGKFMLEAAGRGSVAADADLLALLASTGVVVRTSHGAALSAFGQALAQQLAEKRRSRDDSDIGLAVVEAGPEREIVLSNMSESPIAQLVRRKGRDGRPFLTSSEYEAGERLRADYTKGRIMPRLGANWEASVASGRRGGSAGGMVDLMDAALAARQRVEKALAAVGPELSGVLIDVCCFLKGLEQVETERGWPVRSAKVVLKTALGALARHYDPPPSKKHRKPLLHWGADDYRPSIT